MAPKLNPIQFAALADRQVGKPYVLGAEASLSNLNPSAFDCSELIEWLYGQNGTPITDLAALQFDKTVPVTGEPRVGDLVFLKNNPKRWNRVGHVAVITSKLSNGDWRIIEAKGSRYGVVKTTLSYWKTREYFAGVRRYPAFSLLPMPPVKPKTKASTFRVVSYNIQSPVYGGQKDYGADANFLKSLSPSIVLLQEADETARNKIRSILGPSWKTFPIQGVSVMWDSNVWTYGAHYDRILSPSVHGYVGVELAHRASKKKYFVAAVHIRNKAMAGNEAAQLRDIELVKTMLGSRTNVIVGGDWNIEKAKSSFEASGYQMATPFAPTNLNNRYDFIMTKGLKSIDAKIVDPTPRLSDHKAVLTNIVL